MLALYTVMICWLKEGAFQKQCSFLAQIFLVSFLSQKMPKIAGHNSLQTNISNHSQFSTKLTLTGIVRLGGL